MSEGLDLIKRQQPEFIDDFPTGNIFIGVTKEELAELENELKEHEQYKAIEEELGIDLIKFFMGFKKNVRIYYKKGKKIKEGVMTLGILQKYGKTWALTKEELK